MSANNLLWQKLKDIFWPVKREELGNFVPVTILMFCVLFNQNILRILKDSIVISEISAEIISFTKLYCVTPVAAIFVIIYSNLINRVSLDKIFYYLISIFTTFFVIFAFVIYPNTDFFHLDSSKMHELMAKHHHFKWYIALAGNWGYMIFYTLSELWANVFYVLLFWQIANEITSSKDAARFYTLFSLFGNLSLIVVGAIMINLSSNDFIGYSDPTSEINKVYLVKICSVLIVIFSILSALSVKYLAKHVISHVMYVNTKLTTVRTRLGFMDSVMYIAKSKYLLLILICTASFGFSMNLVELVWKAKIKEAYSSVIDYARFSGWYVLWTGVLIIIMTLIGNNIMRRCGWLISAIISPLIIMVTGIIFFSIVVFDDFSFFFGSFFASSLAFGVFIGAVQNVLAKAAQFSLWDTSKQMLYIPLDKELRTKGKAAVDVFSSKIGKSFSAFIQSFVFTIMPGATYSSVAPAFMIMFSAVCILWIYSIKRVNRMYQNMT